MQQAQKCHCGGAAAAAGAFPKGFEVFSPFGHTSSLGYGLTDRSAEDEEVFSQPLEAVVSWNKELLWSLLAVWQSSLGSAQIQSELGSCLRGFVVISVCCAATLLSVGQGRGEMVGG